MKTSLPGSLLFLLVFAASVGLRAGPVPIIFDTDMSGDVDDVGALAVLNELTNLGEARMLACVTDVGITDKAIGGCIKAVNRYYGNGDVPIGTYRGTKYMDLGSNYDKRVRDQFAGDEPQDDRLPPAVQVYRQALAGASDHSVTIVTVGFLSNLPVLLNSPPDSISPLAGRDLVARKVKHLVVMGGRYPTCGLTTAEVNLSCHNFDGTASLYVSSYWPGPILFVGNEIGDVVTTGIKLKDCPPNDPVRVAYDCFNHFAGRGSWDPTAVLAAVRDPALYWEVKADGYNWITSYGADTWYPTPHRGHSIIAWHRAAADAGTVTRVLDDLMTRPPHGDAKAYNEPGAVEGESLKPVTRPDGDFGQIPYSVQTQREAPGVFSGDGLLYWGTDHGPSSKEQMEVNIPVREDGRYKVFVRLAKGPTCGILKITFEDNDHAPIDCYAPQPGATDPVELGAYDLPAGDHPLDFMIAGVNPAGPRKILTYGLDYVKLVPVTPIGHPQATGADDSSIHSVTVGEPHPVPNNSGDTWDFAWTRQNTIYSSANDTSGFVGGNHNLMFNKIFGEDPTNLSGETVNQMSNYGITGATMGGDGCTWKSSGCMSLDGVLYWLVARHRYGGDRAYDYDKRQKAHNASFIKSTDRGKTWTRPPQENFDHPMFPGSRFAAPYFIQYGQDGHEAWADGSEKYVYALSNNGYWDNGDYVILGRCLRSKMPELNGASWQFYTQGNGATDAAWTSNVRAAKAVVCDPDHLGMTRAVYLPKHQCYFMIGWYYPAGGGKMEKSDGLTEAAHTETTWDFYVAPHPWGPWRVCGSHTWKPQGYYCPGVCPKFNAPDESTIWAFTAGDWTSPYYKLTAVPLSIK